MSWLLRGTRLAGQISRAAPTATSSAALRSFSLLSDPGKADLYAAAQQRQTAVSLQTLHKFGGQAKGENFQKTLQTAACFLHQELPIRFAHRIVELDHLPHGLAAMPGIQKVSSWYSQSFREIRSHPVPDTPDREASFARLLESIYERHGTTIVTMARGIFQFKKSLGLEHGAPLPASMERNVQGYLDMFFSSRVGIRTLISHYVALHHPSPSGQWVGIINTSCVPAKVIADAVSDARAVCERVYGDAPDVDILGATDFAFNFVPSYLHHISFELVKNSMRAVVECHKRKMAGLRHGATGEGDVGGLPVRTDAYPPIKVILAASEGSEDVTIKVSDEGGGIPRSGMRRAFNYFYSTAPPQFDTDDGGGGDAAQDFTRSVPLAGLGVGLPLSRVMARYFAGDLQIVSMEGYGTDAFVFLRRLGDAAEPIAETAFGLPGNAAGLNAAGAWGTAAAAASSGDSTWPQASLPWQMAAAEIAHGVAAGNGGGGAGGSGSAAPVLQANAHASAPFKVVIREVGGSAAAAVSKAQNAAIAADKNAKK